MKILPNIHLLYIGGLIVLTLMGAHKLISTYVGLFVIFLVLQGPILTKVFIDIKERKEKLHYLLINELCIAIVMGLYLLLRIVLKLI